MNDRGSGDPNSTARVSPIPQRRRVLITGGTGFVGANLARKLLQTGHHVHLLVRPGHRDWRIADLKPDIGMHSADLIDRDALDHAIRSIKPEWVFHLATHGAYSYQKDLRTIIETNFLGTVNLVESCAVSGFESFINTGSSSEYGLKDHAPSEMEWLEPNSYYAVTKASATLYCRYTARSRGLHIPTLRLYSVYGALEEPTRLIPRLITCGLKGTLPPLVSPDTARDYVFVDDVVDAYIRAASCPGPEPGAVYNVGSGTQTSLRTVVKVAREVLAIPTEPEWGTMDARNWDTNCWIADNRLIRECLHWQPVFGLKEGFERTVAWFRGQPQLWSIYNDVVGN